MTVDPGSASIVRDLPVVSMKVILTMRTKQPRSGPQPEKYRPPVRPGAVLYTARRAARQGGVRTAFLDWDHVDRGRAGFGDQSIGRRAAEDLGWISFALSHLPRRRRACPGDPEILSTDHQQSRWPGQARPRLKREGSCSDLTGIRSNCRPPRLTLKYATWRRLQAGLL